MNIRFLETVLWLARLRTIKATAEKLCITDAAISSRISAIEQDLGVRLFSKSEKGFLLTKHGEEFIKAANTIVPAYYEMRQRMLDPAELKGNVRIGVVATISMTIFPYVVRMLRDKFPSVSLSIVMDLAQRLFESLTNGQLDICLCDEPNVVPRELQFTHIYSFVMQFVASPRLGIDTSVPLSPADLCRYPVIGYPKGIDTQNSMDAYFRSVDPGKLTFHASNSISTTIHMVSAGLGIAAVPNVVVQKDVEAGSLVVLPTLKALPETSYCALYPSAESTGVPLAISAIAREAARAFCDRFDARLARQLD
ncbi:LysR family transcriptional regulator [Pigmentiphaga soli]|uniref:LysR family transcriptional regulator n=1 Tax=Pigmentiphaga soli TaxID=1007095 RepID=A0ABP8GTB6_9BURK